jgi:hypothetical protein
MDECVDLVRCIAKAAGSCKLKVLRESYAALASLKHRRANYAGGQLLDMI